jgi:F-type H+-transporting ATPase subunit delta
MNGASRQALAAARERLDALTDTSPGSAAEVPPSVDAAELAGELAAVTALLQREGTLRRALSDPGQSGEAKAGLARQLLGSQVGGASLDLVSGMVRARWSRARHLVDAIEELADTADLIAAQRTGALDDVEDELFRFGRIVAGNPDLRSALTGRAAGSEAKTELLHTLLGGRVQPVTERLVTRLVAAPRGRSLENGIESLSKLAAARRDRMIAEVVTAVPLSDQQKERLGAGLARIYGRQVHLNLDVDPGVLGGMRVRVGDEIINGSIADRLDEASRRLAG